MNTLKSKLKCLRDNDVNGSIKVLIIVTKAHPDVAWVYVCVTIMFHLTDLEVGQRNEDYKIHN